MKHLLKRLQSSFQSERLTPPAPNFSWVIPAKLAVGGFPRSQDLIHLSQAGIRSILTLCAEQEGTLPEETPHQFACQRFVLPDSRYEHSLQVGQISQAVALLHQHLEQHPVYIHCLAGMERSPIVCIAYLCQYQKLQLWQASHWLQQVHPPTQPTSEQMRVLRAFVQSL